MTLAVVRAGTADAHVVTTILATGFAHDPVSSWIFPDERERERLHPGFFRPFVDSVLAQGEVYTTEDRAGAALWLPVDVSAHSAGPALGELYEPILGALHASRIAMFDARSTANHPSHANHYYLPFIAVRPDRAGTGIGTALLRDRLSTLDRQRIPSYLEASSQRSVKLYQRLGFTRLDRTTDMPDGPSLYPMWREPAR